jgi:transposase
MTEQQATLMLHKTRELLVKQRTMSVNALRSHLSEFGIISPRESAASTNCSVTSGRTPRP